VTFTDNQARLRDALPATDNDGATPADLAEATGLGYSTVTRLLHELEGLGVAAKDDTGWHLATDPRPQPDADRYHPAEPPADLLDPDDPRTAQEDATPDGDGPDPAPTDVQPDAGSTRTADPAPDDAAPAQRLPKGALREQVLTALRAADAPLGPTELSKRLGGRSQGAIANACDVLVAAGLAELTNERPRRFAATT
jgi:IclR-like helix-turn-helix domain-containing protein